MVFNLLLHLIFFSTHSLFEFFFTVFLDNVYSSPSFLQLHSPFIPTKLCLSPPHKNPIKHRLHCPYTLRCVAFHWSRVNLSPATPLEKTDSLCLESYRLPIAPELEVGFPVYSPFYPMLGFCPCLSLSRSCACCYNF